MAAASDKPAQFLLRIVIAGTVLFVGAVLIAERMKPHDAAETAEAKGGTGLKEQLRSKGRKRDLANIEKTCTSAPESCACNQARAVAALNANLGKEALRELERDAACAREPKSQGMLAEALARSGDTKAAREQALRVREQNARDPFANYALALLEYRAGRPAKAESHATTAVESGRAIQGRLLLAVLHHEAKRFDAALSNIDGILQIDPEDVEALYIRALVAQDTGTYRAAREGYLKVLRIMPTHADSRYRLGVLTHSVGAMDEAKHNLERLKAIAGDSDPRVLKLQGVLDGPAPPPGAGLKFRKPAEANSARPAASTPVAP